MTTPLLFAGTVSSLHITIAWWHWLLLAGWFGLLVFFDLFIIHKKDEEPTLKSAVRQSAVWIGLGILLGLVVFWAYGREAGTQYFSGYLIEKSLSVDNVFAWSVILAYFKILPKYQHRVLFWGILGAIVMRIVFIFAGVAVIHRFEPILIVFGLILVFSGIKLLSTKEDNEFNPGESKLYRLARRVIPMSDSNDGHHLFITKNDKRYATMLFMTLLVIIVSDLVFALDSVPAVLAVSTTPFIVIASNAAAILGMRALYFVFEFIKDKFWLLNHTLGIILLFVGAKMIIAPPKLFGMHWLGYEISTGLSLIVIGALLAFAIFGSLLLPRTQVKK